MALSTSLSSTCRSAFYTIRNMPGDIDPLDPLPAPKCHGMSEVEAAGALRSCLRVMLASSSGVDMDELDPSIGHIAKGLALTKGSAVGQNAPSEEECLAAFLIPNKAGLTAGARAWSKHAHRSQSDTSHEYSAGGSRSLDSEGHDSISNRGDLPEGGYWGRPKGPVSSINQNALAFFHKVFNNATWRNVHILPHDILVYEVRVKEGYGLRWSKQMQSNDKEVNGDVTTDSEMTAKGWVFRGFVEPMMVNGHEVGWRH